MVSDTTARKGLLERLAEGLLLAGEPHVDRLGLRLELGVGLAHQLAQELRERREEAGLDPDALERGDAEAMKFGSDEPGKAKAWKDIWGSGQGIGVIDQIVPAAELVERLGREYREARALLCAG